MDYKEIYTENYFSGKDSFFYSLGYGNFQKTYFEKSYRPLKPYLKEIKRGRVLDVGCAYGFMLEKFPDSFEKYGIDISEYAISEARKRFPNLVLKVTGAEDSCCFSDNFFDVVICNDVIEHLENPRVALENIQKVLKKDGILYLNTPNLNWLRRKLFEYADKKEHHISMMSSNELSRMLKDVGFNILDHYTYTNITPFSFLKFRSNSGPEQLFIVKNSK